MGAENDDFSGKTLKNPASVPNRMAKMTTLKSTFLVPCISGDFGHTENRPRKRAHRVEGDTFLSKTAKTGPECPSMPPIFGVVPYGME